MAKQQPAPPLPPLSDTDLIQVIQGSGYPLEVSLYEQAEQAGMDPSIGLLMRLRDPEGEIASTHEIDLMARVGFHETFGDMPAHAGVNAWIDAKQLHEPGRFIGILGVQPNQHERRVSRSFYTGCPSFRVLQRVEPNIGLFLSDGGVSEALDALSTAPLCVHWGVAKPDGQGTWKLSGDGGPLPPNVKDDRFYQSMSKLVAAVVWHERDASEFFENGTDVNLSPLPSLAVQCPTLIIETPSLPLYDAKAKSLTHVDWFMLRWGAEINGNIHCRIIDIVTVKGVPEMIARYKKTEQALREAFPKHARALRDAGVKIRKASLLGPRRVP